MLFLVTVSVTITLISKDDNKVVFINKLKLVLKNIILQNNLDIKIERKVLMNIYNVINMKAKKCGEE